MANPDYAADLFRHAASYFGNAEAQYRLARLYMNGTGVEKNIGLAVNWLAIAAKKQHAAAQATLGESSGAARKCAKARARPRLIILARENAKSDAKDAQWIGSLYAEVLSKSDKGVRKDAEALLPVLSDVKAPAVLPPAKPAEVLAMPAEKAAQPNAPASNAGSGAPRPRRSGVPSASAGSGARQLSLRAR